MYRNESTIRNKMHDIHAVVGVTSLPFGLLYALTGVMLNLTVVFQIPTVLLLYKGDTNALLKDINIVNITEKPSGVEALMPNISDVIKQIESNSNNTVSFVSLINYGNDNAFYSLSGSVQNTFSGIFNKYYSVNTLSFPQELNKEGRNVVVDGVVMLYSVHYGTFAGLDMRFLFFVLALFICAMIVGGNVLWIVKRQKRAANPKTLATMRALTLGSCVGVIPATAIVFLLERILPVSFETRSVAIEWAFFLVLLVYSAAGFFAKKHKPFIGYGLLMSGIVTALTVIADWIMFAGTMLDLWQYGHQVVLAINLAMAVIAALFLGISRLMLVEKKTNNEDSVIVESKAVIAK